MRKSFRLKSVEHLDLRIILGASLADRSGNLVYKGTSQNFNPLMATAADLVIAEVRELVETGAIAPEAVRTPGIFVDYMVAPAK